MSDTSLHASGTERAHPHALGYDVDERAREQRSPALSVALSLGVCGALLTTSEHQPLPNLAWTIAYLLIAVEVDVRRLEVPIWLSLPCLFVGLLAVGAVQGMEPVRHSLNGAALGTALLLPIWYRGHASAGSLASLAVLGALWGPMQLLEVSAWAAILGAPFLAIRVSAGANPATLPLTVLLGLGAAAHQLF